MRCSRDRPGAFQADQAASPWHSGPGLQSQANPASPLATLASITPTRGPGRNAAGPPDPRPWRSSPTALGRPWARDTSKSAHREAHPEVTSNRSGSGKEGVRAKALPPEGTWLFSRRTGAQGGGKGYSDVPARAPHSHTTAGSRGQGLGVRPRASSSPLCSAEGSSHGRP